MTCDMRAKKLLGINRIIKIADKVQKISIIVREEAFKYMVTIEFAKMKARLTPIFPYFRNNPETKEETV